MYPTGRQIEISADNYAATIVELGGALRELTYAGRPLVVGYPAERPMPAYRGAVLAPWPNRIGDGQWILGGQVHQLAINEPERHTALHGLVAFLPWSITRYHDSDVELECTIHPQTGYPFTIELRMRYGLSVKGLSLQLVARNIGSDTAPYGSSIHPYLVAGSGPIDDWILELPASSILLVDDRLLPTGSIDVQAELDFRHPRRIGSTVLSHTYGNVDYRLDGSAVARLTDRTGNGTEISWDAACPWIQVFSADQPGHPDHRVGLAIEPMTCPPDAFRSGVGLTYLARGQEHQARWTISAINAVPSETSDELPGALRMPDAFPVTAGLRCRR